MYFYSRTYSVQFIILNQYGFKLAEVCFVFGLLVMLLVVFIYAAHFSI